jgi:hypothetical protein
MKATDFEERHATALHLLLVGAAFGTYLVEKDDIVWGFVKNAGGHTVALERGAFAIASAILAIAAYLWRRAPYASDVLYVVGLATLAPLAGFVILVTGEWFRVHRLRIRHRDIRRGDGLARQENRADAPIRTALPIVVSKWGLFAAMVMFTITLSDRVADILVGTLLVVVLSLRASVSLRQRQA